MKKKVLFLELNEFNPDLLKSAAETLDLKHLKRLLSLHQTKIWTTDTYESDYLDPWVQWVSVHTGVPSSKHKIKHLGDVPHLETPQIWEVLSKNGVSSGVWGAMNASRGAADLCRFFLPDPWTASEPGYPEELSALLDPVRYVSKNYLNRSTVVLLKKIGKMLRLIFKRGIGGALLKELLALPLQIKKHGSHPFLFICLADLLYTLLFLEYRKKEKTEFSLVFLNSIAHLQHHHWHESPFGDKKPLAYGFKNLDRIFGLFFASLKEDEIFIVTNAFSQKNTNEEKPWILYRQIDQALFLKAVGIDFERVEPHMTHDAHIFFASEGQAQAAKAKLAGATIENAPLFLVEAYPDAPNKLFYRIQFTDELKLDARLILDGKDYPFFTLFKPIIRRTGKHIPEGTIFCSESIFPELMLNHELFPTLFFELFPKSREPAWEASEDRRA